MHHLDIAPLPSPQFTKAVEQKQVAEQDAERAKFVVMLAEQVGTRRALLLQHVMSHGNES